MVDTVELVKTFVILLAIIDPIGNIPVIMALTGNKSGDEYRSITLKTSCLAFLFLN